MNTLNNFRKTLGCITILGVCTSLLSNSVFCSAGGEQEGSEYHMPTFTPVVEAKSPEHVAPKQDTFFRYAVPNSEVAFGCIVESDGTIAIKWCNYPLNYSSHVNEITIPNEIHGKPVTKIMSGAFHGLGFSTLYINSNLKEMQKEAFVYCPELSEIFIVDNPDFVIDMEAFASFDTEQFVTKHISSAPVPSAPAIHSTISYGYYGDN